MAKQSNNVVTYGLRGKIGNLLIFRQVDGDKIIVTASDLPGNVTEEEQIID